MVNNILISRETREVLSKDNRFIGMEGENLQEVLVFNLDEELEGSAIIEIQFPDETTGFIQVDKTEKGYELPIKSSLLAQSGLLKMQLRILQEGQEIFKSEIIRFKVKESINATATIPDEYPTWIDNLESLKTNLEEAESKRTETFEQMQKDVETAVAELEHENTVLKNQIPTGQASGENITLNDSAGDIEFKKFEVCGNSIQDGTATPESPIEIQNVNGSVNIIVCNKNLANTDLLFEEMKAFNSEQCRIENVENKECIVFRNIQFTSDKGFKGLSNRYKENTRYIIKARCRVYDTNITSGYSLFIQAFDIDNNNIGIGYTAAKGNEWIDITFLTNEKTSLSHIAFSFGDNTYWCIDKESFIIAEYKGKADISYIPHKSQQITFPLSEGQRMYKDSYLADDGIHHKRGQYQFTGNETMLTDLELTNTRRYYNNLKVVNAKSTLAVSNRFVQADSATDLNNNDNQKILTLNGGQFAFRLNKTIANGVTELKSWLAENPVIVEYELAEEIIEPYTEEQQAVYNEIKKTISYKNITHIFSTDETSPIFEVTYRKDLESILNNINTAIVSLGGV